MSVFVTKAMEYMRLARKLARQGDYSGALEAYKRARTHFLKAAKYARTPEMARIYREFAARIDAESREMEALVSRLPKPQAEGSPRGGPGAPAGKRVGGGSDSSGESGMLEQLDEEARRRAESFITPPTGVSWDDIADLESVKKEVMSALFFSLAKPSKPVEVEVPRRFLLFGPPGTGKTLLASAASTMLKATFMNVSIEGILSRYVGDSPKILSAVFKVAEEKAPTVVFLDEIEALATKRDMDHQGVTGLLQTMLTVLDGVKKKAGEPIIVIAATNKPWLLDEAVLSRFDRIIYVPLPDPKAREEIFRIHLERKGYEIEGITYEELAKLTEGYSGREIAKICKRAITLMLQRANPNIEEILSKAKSAEDYKKMRYNIQPIKRDELLQAIQETRPAVSEIDIKKYELWLKSRG